MSALLGPLNGSIVHVEIPREHQGQYSTFAAVSFAVGAGSLRR